MDDKKRILMVSSAFYPEISPRSFRATELAKEFCRQGHNVTLISRYRDHDYADFLREFPITFKMWGKSRFPRVPAFKLKLLALLSRWLSRILLILCEYPGIEEMFKVKNMLKHESGYDLLISFAYPHPVHWGTAWSRSGKHRIAGTWVADCGDPYMGDVIDSFRKLFYFGYLEKWFCRKADFISIPVESARSAYYPDFQNKIKIIPQGFDFDLNIKHEEKMANNEPEFAYAGGFLYNIRDPKILMQYLVNIDKPFVFYVFTDKPGLLSEYKLALNEKLIVSEYVPRDQLMMVLSKVDFLINFDNNTKIHVPSKLIDYAITNRPVLNIDKSFNIEDLMAFLGGDYKKRMPLPDPKQYYIKNIARHFLDLVLIDSLS